MDEFVDEKELQDGFTQKDAEGNDLEEEVDLEDDLDDPLSEKKKVVEELEEGDPDFEEYLNDPYEEGENSFY